MNTHHPRQSVEASRCQRLSRARRIGGAAPAGHRLPHASRRHERRRRAGADARRSHLAAEPVPPGGRRAVPGHHVGAPLRQGPGAHDEAGPLVAEPAVPDHEPARTAADLGPDQLGSPQPRLVGPAGIRGDQPGYPRRWALRGTRRSAVRPGGRRPRRGDRVGCGAAVVHRPGRHARRVLSRALAVQGRRPGPARAEGDLPVGRVHRRLPRLLHPRRCRRERLRPRLAVPDQPRRPPHHQLRRRTPQAPPPRRVVGGHHARRVEDQGPDPGVHQLLRRQPPQRRINAGLPAGRLRATATPTRTAGRSGPPSTARKHARPSSRSSTGTCATGTPPRCRPCGWRSGTGSTTS